MGRIIAIDYGKKRVGLAFSDPTKTIANNAGTVGNNELFSWLKNFNQKETIEALVIGDPKKNDNSPSESKYLVDNFIAAFSKQYPSVPVILFDERYTSKMAFRVMIDAGLKKKARQNKSLVDSISATIMLEEYLTILKNKT